MFFSCKAGTGISPHESTRYSLSHTKEKDSLTEVFFFGVPDWIRTNGTRRRRPVLYPAELRIRFREDIIAYLS